MVTFRQQQIGRGRFRQRSFWAFPRGDGGHLPYVYHMSGICLPYVSYMFGIGSRGLKQKYIIYNFIGKTARAQAGPMIDWEIDDV